MAEEEGHPAERIYFRHRSLSDDSVNKTILKPPLALTARRQYVYVGFSRRKIPRIAVQVAGSAGKASCVYDIGESNPVPGSGL